MGTWESYCGWVGKARGRGGGKIQRARHARRVREDELRGARVSADLRGRVRRGHRGVDEQRALLRGQQARLDLVLLHLVQAGAKRKERG